jgi:glycosyltransferase involved in cell wall biosynthesis
MKCGAPVIVGNATSLPEVVGDAGLKVDPFDVAAIADAMDQLIKNSELRQQLIAKGLMQAKMFDWRETAKQSLKVYEQVVRGTYRSAAS